MPGIELFGVEEQKEVAEVLQSGILSRYGFETVRPHWKAKDLELACCREFGCEYAHLTNSGTTALLSLLMAAGIGAGHEVIMPAFAHPGCFEAIILTGAVPVIADIDESLTLDPESVAQRISPKTKAVLAVHTAGAMADMTRLMDIAAAHSLFLFEDATQAVGAGMNGTAAGCFSTGGFISLDISGTLTTGEGGLILTNDPVIYKRCDEYSDHGHDHLGAKRSEDQHRYIGNSLRISELQAAVGLAQIRKLEGMLQRQRASYEIFAAEISRIPQVRLRTAHGTGTGGWLTVCLPSGPSASAVVAALSAAGISHAYWYDSRWHYLHRWEHFRNGSWMNRLYDDQKKEILHHSNQVFPVSDRIMSHAVSFAISLSWTDEAAAETAKSIRSILQQALEESNLNQKDFLYREP